MEIKKIKMNNFRQFYGEQEINFAGKGGKNVTLIHAENGVGKTTLLNSILWAFFGETTKKFEQKDQIVNFEAQRDGAKFASVEVLFAHEGVDYLVSRAHCITDNGGVKPRFSVMSVQPNGSLGAPLPNPDAFINSVIPAVMAPYFFFDGEQAETFSSEANNKKIAEAIRDILGSTLIQTAQGDLRYVAKKFGEEIGSASGDAEIERLEKKLAELEAGRDRREEKIQELEANIDAFEEQLKKVSNALIEARETEHYERERLSKEDQLKTISSQIDETKAEILRWISTKSIAAISERLTSQSLDFIDEESLKGRIPSPYNEDFVRGLLESKKCVCERSLEPGTSEWRAIQGMLSNAANAEVLSRVVRARARSQMLKELHGDAPGILKSAEEKLARLTGFQNTLQREIAEIRQKLEALPVAEIQQRERARRELENRLDEAKREKNYAVRDNHHSDEEIKRIDKIVSELALENIATRKLIIRRDLALRAEEFLKAFLEAKEQEARQEIENAVNRVLVNTTRRHYKFELDETFQMRLLFEDGRPTPKSGGENQMMSLAFLAALVQFAEKRSLRDDNALFIPATVAPLILDSPFGQLDNAYRKATAEFVPEMAPQVVLLVSSSQGKEEVVKALEHRVGAEYVLIAHNRGKQDGKQQDCLEVGGKKIATTLFEQARNMTEITEVQR